jgi:hypothetical protein
MKKRICLSGVLLGFLLTACKHHPGNTSIELRESDHYYNMDAWFLKTEWMMLKHI